ncbi:hypothetical protein I5U56_09690 [Stenotrophomonas maltophilia]|nr:hypothetical protein [Stenotrophomonas maltophilia]MBH1600945.1 hypothetical protein [Stenotrophomonas maltophilia]
MPLQMTFAVVVQRRSMGNHRVMNWLFLVSIVGILIFYPAHFYFCTEFKMRLRRDHPELSARSLASFDTTYRQLRAVREGRLDGVLLSKDVCDSHRLASRFLHLGMTSFMILLAVGLCDSVWGGN